MTGCELPVLILGCGYVGKSLARQLQERGMPVLGWVRSQESAAELQAEGIPSLHGNIAEPAAWEKLADQQFAAIVHCASSDRSGPEGYRVVYYWGLYQAIVHGRGAPLIFVSSTSVYAQANGEWVDETSRAEPSVETGRILRKAEAMALGAGGAVLRLAGIYGPGRSMLAQKYLNGEAVIEGDGRRVINQIHRDDAASAIRRLLEMECPSAIYNGVDDEPVDAVTFYTWCSRHFQRPMPPCGPVKTDRKRGVTNKCVSNRALRATGWAPRYPTFREGLSNAFSLHDGDATPLPPQLPPLDVEPPTIEEPGLPSGSPRMRTRRRFPPRLSVIGAGLALLAELAFGLTCSLAQTLQPGALPNVSAVSPATPTAPPKYEAVAETPDRQLVIQRREMGLDAGGIMRHRVEIVSRRTSKMALQWTGRWRALSVVMSPSGKMAAINDFTTTQGDCLYVVNFVPAGPTLPGPAAPAPPPGTAKPKAPGAAAKTPAAKAPAKSAPETAAAATNSPATSGVLPPLPPGATYNGPVFLHKPDHLALNRAMQEKLKRLGKIERITLAADSWKDDSTLQLRVFGRSAQGPFDEAWVWHFLPDGSKKESYPKTPGP
ncbi:MAG TPA: NAD-dependent epimerase/dehydratase family protein [Candidatus Methylacidiphilales bacterium]|nr:NAD-dependent epimerase/dehydratase family protein [Candidatus Methylacidiphilales bacterium]